MLNYRIVTGDEAMALFDKANQAYVEGSNALETDVCNHLELLNDFMNITEFTAELDDQDPAAEEASTDHGEDISQVMGYFFDSHISKPLIAGGDVWDMHKTYHCLWMVYTVGVSVRVKVIYILMDSLEGDGDPEVVPVQDHSARQVRSSVLSMVAKDALGPLPYYDKERFDSPGYQQEFLRNTAKSLDITQKEMAERLDVPWSTFRKWLAPEGSGDYRKAPTLVFIAVHYLEQNRWFYKRWEQLLKENMELRRGKKKEKR